MRHMVALFIAFITSQGILGATPPTPIGTELERTHAAFVLCTTWIDMIERHGVSTNEFPRRLEDVKGHGTLSLVDPWGRPLTYRLLSPGSYALAVETTSGTLSFIRLAFTKVPQMLPDSDKLVALQVTIDNLQRALDATFTDDNEYPSRLEEIPERHFPPVWPLTTPWGLPITYRRSGRETYSLEASTPFGPIRIENGVVKASPIGVAESATPRGK